MQHATIAFIGAGNMASSLIGGLIADRYDPNKIWASHPNAEKLNYLEEKWGIHTTTDNKTATQHADIVVLCTKPQALKSVTLEIAPALAYAKPLIISIAAGIRTTDLQHWLKNDIAIVRCMPNTPSMIRAGATALFANKYALPAQKNVAESILRAVGITVWVEEEEQLDIVTALSGSGPAYFFLVMEALEQAAIDLGLPTEKAYLLTLQTALGAARMALEANEPVATLRQRVTSPGGTTEHALNVLKQAQLETLFARAVSAAKQRASELAQLFGE